MACTRAGVLLLLVSLPAAAAAQTEAARPVRRLNDHAAAPQVHAATLRQDLHMDGKLDDAAWLAAEPAGLAAQLDPNEGEPPSERTEIRVLVDQHALYIGARLYDDHPDRIVSRLGRRDERPASDRLTIRIDSRHDHLTAFLFDVFPAGNKGDASVGSDEHEDYSWDPVWEVATTIDSLGWTAEIRIPLSQLRYNRDSRVWGIQVIRFIQRRQEEDVFSYVPKTENAGVNRYGHLTGLRGLPATRRVEVTPYVAGRAEYQPAQAGDPFARGHDYTGSAGADFKVGLGSNLTLDGTVNPDFGQVEVDPAVVNLTAFETVFDEKRPFFVEGADLFSFGNLRTYNAFTSPITFFSRRIGRPPQGAITAPGAAFADVPGQTTIAAAGKLTGKTENGWSIALLDAVTPTENGNYVLPGSPVIRHQAVEPFTNYFVGRLRRELRQGNTAVGMLVTAVNRSLSEPALEAELRSQAYAGGIDFNHAWGNRNWALDASLAGSRIAGSPAAIARAQRASARYYQRPDAHNLHFDSTRTALSGYTAQLAVTKIGGGHWGGNLAYQEKSPGFESNDLGLTQTTGRRGISTDLHYYQPRPGLFRNWTVGVLSGNDWNYDGNHTTSYLGNIIELRLRNFWSYHSQLFYDFSAYDDQLTRGGPLARLPQRGNWDMFLESDDRGVLSLQLEGHFNWNTAGGYATRYGAGVVFQPGPNLQVSLEPSYSRYHNLSQYVTTVDDPTATATFGRRTVFATVEQREVALTTRLNWTFSPMLSLQLYLQPFVSTGAYHDYKEFRAPGTFNFDSYGRNRGTIAQDPATGDFTVDPDGAGPAPAFGFPAQDFNFRSLRANLVMRWEYRPGSTLFLVWQHSRAGAAGRGDFSFRRDFNAIFDYPGTNVVAVKMTWWLGV